MSQWKKIAPLASVLVLAGCRIDIAVPTGGTVETDSGSYSCAAGQNCQVEVEDTAFAETFTAQPGEGQIFAGWEKVERGLCGGSLEPCELDASLVADNPVLLAVLESDAAFNLQPQFMPVDEVHVYQVGDQVRFAGTLSRSSGGTGGEEVVVTARLEFQEPTYTEADKPVLAARLTVAEADGGAVYDWTVHLWQESGGFVYQLTDASGNTLLNTASNENGIPSIPVPLVPFDSRTVQYSAMWSGHTSTPLTTGERVIEVGESATVSTQRSDFQAYPVSISDEYTYLVSYDPFKRDQSVSSERNLWISPAKGVVKLQVTEQVFNESGKLETSQTLDLEFVNASF